MREAYYFFSCHRNTIQTRTWPLIQFPCEQISALFLLFLTSKNKEEKAKMEKFAPNKLIPISELSSSFGGGWRKRSWNMRKAIQKIMITNETWQLFPLLLDFCFQISFPFSFRNIRNISSQLYIIFFLFFLWAQTLRILNLHANGPKERRILRIHYFHS